MVTGKEDSQLLTTSSRCFGAYTAPRHRIVSMTSVQIIGQVANLTNAVPSSSSFALSASVTAAVRSSRRLLHTLERRVLSSPSRCTIRACPLYRDGHRAPQLADDVTVELRERESIDDSR